MSNNMKYSSFYKKLEWGKEGEKEICDILADRGESFMPLYQFDDNVSPKIMDRQKLYTSPDIIRFVNGKVVFAEVKRKNFWVEWSGELETGFDLSSYKKYIEVSKLTNCNVEIYFVQEIAPVGVYKWVIKPTDTVENTDICMGGKVRYGNSGTFMAHFNIKDLEKIK